MANWEHSATYYPWFYDGLSREWVCSDRVSGIVCSLFGLLPLHHNSLPFPMLEYYHSMLCHQIHLGWKIQIPFKFEFVSSLSLIRQYIHLFKYGRPSMDSVLQEAELRTCNRFKRRLIMSLLWTSQSWLNWSKPSSSFYTTRQKASLLYKKRHWIAHETPLQEVLQKDPREDAPMEGQSQDRGPS